MDLDELIRQAFRILRTRRLREDFAKRQDEWLDRLIYEDPERYQAILNGKAKLGQRSNLDPHDEPADWGDEKQECPDEDVEDD